MRFVKLTFVLSLLFFTACSKTKKKNSNSDFKLSEIQVNNATVQEMVSGIEGGYNTLKFSMNIVKPSKDLVPDSLIFGKLKMKLVLKNETTNQYVASVANRSKQPITNTEMMVDFKFLETNKISVMAEYKVLEPVYMP